MSLDVNLVREQVSTARLRGLWYAGHALPRCVGPNAVIAYQCQAHLAQLRDYIVQKNKLRVYKLQLCARGSGADPL